MNKFFLIFVALFVSGCAHEKASDRSCGELKYYSKTKIEIKTISVDLLSRPKEPSFYLFAGESDPYHHYAILLKPEAVLAELESFSKIRGGSKWVEALIEKIKADLPLKENTDIEKYGLFGYPFMGAQKTIALNLIEKNQASIVDFWRIESSEEISGKVLKKVVFARVGYAPEDADAREVCELSGDSILELIERVY